jgi:hypothetical protein
MPSVDDLLRQAFQPTDDEWVRRAPSARSQVVRRHRRHQVVRRSVVGGLAAAALVVAVTVADSDARTRTVEPADPSPTPTSTAPAGATALEGTWISASLRAADVRTAARRAGVPAVAATMLDDLPAAGFRVVMVVRGSSLRTLVRSAGAEDAIMDEEVISTTGQDLRLSTLFGEPGTTVHRWTVQRARLTMTFGSTTEGVTDGVPGEAWHRLLYDSAPFTR